MIIEKIYDVGDYILLDDKVNDTWKSHMPYGIIANLMDIFYMVKIFYPNRKISRFEYIDEDGYGVYFANDKNFVRKMTEQEIEDLKIILTAEKYNL